MILIRPVSPTAATALRSRRTRSRIPTAAASELKDADLAAEPLQVISWLLETSVLYSVHGFIAVAFG